MSAYIAASVASHPLLWVAPLAVYLATFAIAFARAPLVPHRIARWAAFPALALTVALLVLGPLWLPGVWSLPAHLLTLFAIALYGHGELARLRPPAADLTSFYLFVSIGGMAGGLTAAVGAPAPVRLRARVPPGPRRLRPAPAAHHLSQSAAVRSHPRLDPPPRALARDPGPVPSRRDRRGRHPRGPGTELLRGVPRHRRPGARRAALLPRHRPARRRAGPAGRYARAPLHLLHAGLSPRRGSGRARRARPFRPGRSGGARRRVARLSGAARRPVPLLRDRPAGGGPRARPLRGASRLRAEGRGRDRGRAPRARRRARGELRSRRPRRVLLRGHPHPTC